MVRMVKKLTIVPKPRIKATNLGAKFRLIKKIAGVIIGGIAL